MKAFFRYTIFLVLSFLLIFVGLGGASFAVAEDVAPSEPKKTIEEEKKDLAEVEEIMESLQGVINEKQKESSSLERDLSIIDAQIKKAKLGIRVRDNNIKEISSGIKVREATISQLQEKILREKTSLAELIRKTNEMDSTSLIEIILVHDNFSDFFVDADNFEDIHAAVQVSFDEIRTTTKKKEKEADNLLKEKEEEVKLRASQIWEKNKAETDEAEKQLILMQTKGIETAYKKMLEEKQQTAAEIRSRIFRLSGDTQLPFGEAVRIAIEAEKMTGGVRAAFILSVLAQESSMNGIFGANLGQCNYNDSKPNKSGTVMSNTQKPSFLAIMKEIGRDPNNTPVSCPIVYDGAYGGAMGPAQFMPTTWWDIKNGTGYKKRIASVTGHNPPSPFDNLDAFTGTALYLKDAYNSSACVSYASVNQNVLPYEYLRERCAAAKYYAGGNWRAHRLGYGDRVAERADKFQKDIDVLNK